MADDTPKTKTKPEAPVDTVASLEKLAAISAGVDLGTKPGRVELANGTVVETY